MASGWAMHYDNEYWWFSFFNLVVTCLVSKCRHISKKFPSSWFLFICWHFETKRVMTKLDKKKSQIFFISVYYPPWCQVPPVLKSTFKFWILTPNLHCITTNHLSRSLIDIFIRLTLQFIHYRKRSIQNVRFRTFCPRSTILNFFSF